MNGLVGNMLKRHCPHCGTFGKPWNKKPEAFICPNCLSVFSEFGIIAQPDFEEHEDELISSCN